MSKVVTWGLVAPAHALQQSFMGQPDKALRQWQIVQQARGLAQRGAIIQNLADVGLFRRAFVVERNYV